MEWNLEPGEPIKRTDLHKVYGGRTQGGIGPSRQTPNVLIFSDSRSGEQHGYLDGWRLDGCFHFTGEGQHGDQLMKSGNASILNHKSEGRALRVFWGARGTVIYAGEYEVDKSDPWYAADAPESGQSDVVRKVIVFRLRPIDTSPGEPELASFEPAGASGPIVDQVAIEANNTERAMVDPERKPHEAERREAQLVGRFATFMLSAGHPATRVRIVPTGEHRPLFCDLRFESLDLLVEAKGSVTRECVRMAIGQLIDYGRFVDVATRAVLLPEKPRADLLALASAAGVDVIWEEGELFISSANELLPAAVAAKPG